MFCMASLSKGKDRSGRDETKMKLIEARDLSHKQGSKFLLQGINWDVNENEHWIVFGANGCGKTTLLSAVAGYRSYSKGEVKLFGERLSRENAVLLRRSIGFVSASYMDRCFRHESGLDIVLSAKFGGFGRRLKITDADARKAMQLLHAFGIAGKANYPYDMLSQGQRQKVLLARALMVPPRLLLLDEPVNGLDIVSRNFFLNTLQEIIATENTSVVYVTHHVEEILPFYTKALLLKDGKMYMQGNIKEVFSDKNMTDFFGYSTRAEWQGEQLHLVIGKELRMPKEIWA